MAGDPLERKDDLERIEMDLLLDGIFRQYSFDFRGYAVGSLKRRLWRRIRGEGLTTLSGLQEKILHDPECMERLLLDLSINVTSMFRDPSFFRSFRTRVVPLLRTYPFIRLWNAGCSSGEETLSIAILLKEEGLYDRTRIYATDINDQVLARAGEAMFPLERMRDYTENYIKAGGTQAFSSYYATDGEAARFDPSLMENVIFAQHNLVSDGSFNEFNVILCRNVMIYFAPNLQNRVHDLFYDSLVRLGVLGMGHKESIKFTSHESCYQELDAQERLYRRIQ